MSLMTISLFPPPRYRNSPFHPSLYQLEGLTRKTLPVTFCIPLLHPLKSTPRTAPFVQFELQNRLEHDQSHMESMQLDRPLASTS